MAKTPTHCAHIFSGPIIQTEHSKSDLIILLHSPEASAEKLNISGLKSSEDSLTHMVGWWLIMAISWNLSRGSFLKHLCMASLCWLGFLIAWLPGSKVVYRESEQARGSLALYRTQPQENCSITSTELFSEQSVNSPRLKERENRLNLLMRSMRFCKACRTWNVAVGIFGKYICTCNILSHYQKLRCLPTPPERLVFDERNLVAKSIGSGLR